MEGESGATRSSIDELDFLDILGDQMEGESVVTRSIIDELHSSDIQGEQMEGPSGVTRSIIDETHSSVSSEIKENAKAVLFEVSLMKFLVGISKEIKWKVNASCYSKYH